jgi:hypothetical protein
MRFGLVPVGNRRVVVTALVGVALLDDELGGTIRWYSNSRSPTNPLQPVKSGW